MLDRRARTFVAPSLHRAAVFVARRGVGPGAVTLGAFVLGMGAAVAAGAAVWWPALALWLASRVLDGLDGAVARQAGATTDRGGYLDIVGDFTVYGAVVVGCAVGAPQARLALLVLLGTYYVNGTAFLALSSIVERRRQTTGLEDERSFVFSRGLAEGTETIVAHGLFLLFPSAMAPLAWTFAAVVAVTALQRVLFAVRVLEPAAAEG